MTKKKAARLQRLATTSCSLAWGQEPRRLRPRPSSSPRTRSLLRARPRKVPWSGNTGTDAGIARGNRRGARRGARFDHHPEAHLHGTRPRCHGGQAHGAALGPAAPEGAAPSGQGTHGSRWGTLAPSGCRSSPNSGRRTSGAAPGRGTATRDVPLTIRPRAWILFTRGSHDCTHWVPTGATRTVADAAWHGIPVVGLAASPDTQLPRDLIRVADCRLSVGPLDTAILSAVIREVTGRTPKGRVPDGLGSRLTPALLRLARRPRQSADAYLAQLAEMVAEQPGIGPAGPRWQTCTGWTRRGRGASGGSRTSRTTATARSPGTRSTPGCCCTACRGLGRRCLPRHWPVAPECR